MESNGTKKLHNLHTEHSCAAVKTIIATPGGTRNRLSAKVVTSFVVLAFEAHNRSEQLAQPMEMRFSAQSDIVSTSDRVQRKHKRHHAPLRHCDSWRSLKMSQFESISWLIMLKASDNRNARRWFSIAFNSSTLLAHNESAGVSRLCRKSNCNRSSRTRNTKQFCWFSARENASIRDDSENCFDSEAEKAEIKFEDDKLAWVIVGH